MIYAHQYNQNMRESYHGLGYTHFPNQYPRYHPFIHKQVMTQKEISDIITLMGNEDYKLLPGCHPTHVLDDRLCVVLQQRHFRLIEGGVEEITWEEYTSIHYFISQLWL